MSRWSQRLARRLLDPEVLAGFLEMQAEIEAVMTTETPLEMTNEETLALIQARRRAITPGPWQWNSYSMIFADVPKEHALDISDDDDALGFAGIATVSGGPKQRGDELHLEEARANAEFIANAPEDVAWLLGEQKRWQRLALRYYAEVQRAHHALHFWQNGPGKGKGKGQGRGQDDDGTH